MGATLQLYHFTSASIVVQFELFCWPSVAQKAFKMSNSHFVASKKQKMTIRCLLEIQYDTCAIMHVCVCVLSMKFTNDTAEYSKYIY